MGYDSYIKVLEEMMDEVFVNNVAHGWFDAERDFGMDVALLHSEVSEMLEEFRVHGLESFTSKEGKPEDVGSECADVLIRLLDTCKRTGTNLGKEYQRKMEYNRTRPYKHGKNV